MKRMNDGIEKRHPFGATIDRYMSFRGRVGWAIAAFAAHLLYAAEQLELSQPAMGADGVVQFSVDGPAGTEYTIEGSEELRLWIPLARNTLSSTPAMAELAPRGTGRSYYYRAHRVVPEPNLVLEPDPEQKIEAYLVAGAAPTTLELSTTQGITYTLRIPEGAVIEPVDISMTVLTNALDGPFDEGMLAGVLFEPAGLYFYNPPLLEITFPTNIPLREIVSYQFQADGSGLSLVPNLVYTNRVVMPVRHFSGLGSSRASLQQIAAREYFEVRDATDAVSHQIASELSQERQAQLQGDPNATSPNLGNLIVEGQRIVEREVQRRLGDAQSNCALSTRVLIPQLLGMQRQTELLGAESTSTGLLDALTGGARDRCRTEALERCAAGQEICGFSELLGIERQMQLLGSGDSGDALEEILAQCTPPTQSWSGSIQYTEEGRRLTSGTDGTVDESFAMTAFAIVSQVFGGGPLPFATLELCGTGQALRRYSRRNSDTITCVDGSKTGTYYGSREEVAFGDLTFSVFITGSGDDIQVDIGGTDLVGAGRELSRTVTVRCGADSVSAYSRHTYETAFSYMSASGTGVSGTYQAEGLRENLPTQIKVTWAFNRNE